MSRTEDDDDESGHPEADASWVRPEDLSDHDGVAGEEREDEESSPDGSTPPLAHAGGRQDGGPPAVLEDRGDAETPPRSETAPSAPAPPAASATTTQTLILSFVLPLQVGGDEPTWPGVVHGICGRRDPAPGTLSPVPPEPFSLALGGLSAQELLARAAAGFLGRDAAMRWAEQERKAARTKADEERKAARREQKEQAKEEEKRARLRQAAARLSPLSPPADDGRNRGMAEEDTEQPSDAPALAEESITPMQPVRREPEPSCETEPTPMAEKATQMSLF